ncbi:MAG TPA: translation initiation factor eIF-1A [Thermoplasmata archaeon]|nr:translation initiation factor eIF-1A [Thermoplasmata archaeon]
MADTELPEPPASAAAPGAIETPASVVVVAEGGEEVGRLPMPRRARGEIFGVASQLLGAARIRVMCEDNISRMGRITGKMKKKMWIREGDLLILRPWGFQEGKADILFRYSRTQATYLARRNLLPASVDVFSIVETPSDAPPAA